MVLVAFFSPHWTAQPSRLELELLKTLLVRDSNAFSYDTSQGKHENKNIGRPNYMYNINHTERSHTCTYPTCTDVRNDLQFETPAHQHAHAYMRRETGSVYMILSVSCITESNYSPRRGEPGN